MISAGQPHKATPLTGAMAVAIAARLEGAVAHAIAVAPQPGKPVLIEHASGLLPVEAVVENRVAIEAVVFRTARRLMEGRVLIPAEVWPQASSGAR